MSIKIQIEIEDNADIEKSHLSKNTFLFDRTFKYKQIGTKNLKEFKNNSIEFENNLIFFVKLC